MTTDGFAQISNPNISPGRLALRKTINARSLLNIPGISAKYKVLPSLAERALAPVSSSSCGIGSFANPHLNNDLGTIIAFPDKTFGLKSSDRSGCRLHDPARTQLMNVPL
jgi:hypothetical protein